MSLPTSEPLPDDINELPPARQRHIRRQPRLASLPERQILLDSLVEMTSPKLDFFLLSLLGSAFLGASLSFDHPVILLVALVIFPFLKPVFNLSLVPTSWKVGQGVKSLVSLLILLLLTFGAGVFAGWLRKTPPAIILNILQFSQPSWLNLILISGSSLLSAFILLREGRLPGQLGVILSYEILTPLAIAGASFTLGNSDAWPGALFVSLLHLSLAFFLPILVFGFLGFTPRRPLGWLMAFIPLTLILATLFVTLDFSTHILPLMSKPSPTATKTLQPIFTSTQPATRTLPSTEETIPPTTTLTPTVSPSLTQTATTTPTPEPTTFWIVVNSEIGAVIREAPQFSALVVGYANNGDLIEILGFDTDAGGVLWYQVRTSTGTLGWLLGSLAATPTPTPPES